MAGILGSVMQNIFGGTTAANSQAPANPGTPKVPGNFPVNPASVPNPNNPTNPVQVATQEAPASPLDKFNELWNTDPNAKPNTPVSLFANLDPASIAAAAAKNDFTKVVTPEMAAALAAGGPGAVEAAKQMMNAMSQKAFGDSAVASTKIMENALTKQREMFLAELPSIIKNQTLSENLRNTNPIFSNPAVAPMLEMMKNQVASKHPNLSSAEQTKMAQEYVIAFAQVANPAAPTAAQKKAAGETDWNSFLL
jgi:hypothetical protein